MRIIYLHQYFNTPAMPGGTRSYELARRLVASGHQVHMITTDRDARSQSKSLWHTSKESGIDVHWANVPYNNSMSFFKRLKAFIKFAVVASRRAHALKGDVVFATSTPLTIAIPALYASKRSRIPMVFEVRDLWPGVPIALGVLKNPLSKWLARKLELMAYRNSAQIVALAPGMKEEIAKTGYSEAQITVIPNGCDIELFANSKQRALQLRHDYIWLQDRPLVAYVGTIGRINAVDFLVDMAAHVWQLNPEIRIAVVGAGIEAENVREQARKLGVLDKNFFMLGEMPKMDAVAWTSAATITIALVNGPRFIWKDATQNKFFDSLAAGRPVASNYDGWQAQIAADAGAGIILDRVNCQHASQQLVDAISNKCWMERAAKVAMLLARDKYSRDLHAVELEGVLRLAAGAIARINK